MTRHPHTPDNRSTSPATTPYNSAADRWAEDERIERQRRQQRIFAGAWVALLALLALLGVVFSAFLAGQASPRQSDIAPPRAAVATAVEKDIIVEFEGTGIEIVRASTNGAIVYARMRSEGTSPYMVEYVAERRNPDMVTAKAAELIGKDARVHPDVVAVPLRHVSLPSYFKVSRDEVETARFTNVLIDETCASGDTTKSLAVCRKHSESATGKRRCGMVSKRLDACYQGDIVPVAWAVVGDYVWVAAHREAPTDAYMLLGVSLKDAPLY